MKKGISPLIAAVILIAFVVAVAGIASGFFTGFAKKRQSEIEEKGAVTVDCSSANFEIDPDTVNFDSASSTLTLTTIVKGNSDLTNFSMTLYDDSQVSDQDKSVVHESGPFSPGDVLFLNGSQGNVNPPLVRVVVRTPDCSGISDGVENESGNTNWVEEELSDRFENL